MLFNPINGQASKCTELHLDTDELVILNRLLAKTAISATSLPAGQIVCAPQAVEVAARLYKFRRNRELRTEHAFGAGLFADPAWDMLLDLFIHHARGLDMSISNVCLGSIAPATTALRHLAELERRGIVIRRPHPSDKRVLHVSLSSEALSMMNAILVDFVDVIGPIILPAPQIEGLPSH